MGFNSGFKGLIFFFYASFCFVLLFSLLCILCFCSVFCIVLYIVSHIVLSPIFVHVYWPLPPGGNLMAVKYHIIYYISYHVIIHYRVGPTRNTIPDTFDCICNHQLHNDILTLSWPAGHIFPTYKESFQDRWDNSIPLFLHAAIYLEVSLFRWTSQNSFSRETALYKWYCVQCCMQHCTQYHLYTAVSWENAFWLVQRIRDTSR